MVKAIFFDIDGTLVSFENHKIPESTIESIDKLREKGIKLFIATGRPASHLEYIRENFGLEFDGYVTLNGQYCLADGKVVHENYILPEDIEKVIPYLNENKITCDFMESDYDYYNLISDHFLKLRESNKNEVMKPVDDTNRIYSNKTYQLTMFVDKETEDEIMEYLPNCKGVRWHPALVDIISKDGGKSVGIEKLISHYGISIDETMAFGDGGNDIDMLQAARYGVAMGNASDDVKAYADYVTSSVDDDGILNALKYFEVL